MSKLLSPGVLTGLFTAAGSIATAYGASGLASFFGDPALPGHVLLVLGTVLPIVAGFLPSHKTPAA